MGGGEIWRQRRRAASNQVESQTTKAAETPIARSAFVSRLSRDRVQATHPYRSVAPPAGFDSEKFYYVGAYQDWSCVPQAATKAKWGDFATGIINHHGCFVGPPSPFFWSFSRHWDPTAHFFICAKYGHSNPFLGQNMLEGLERTRLSLKGLVPCVVNHHSCFHKMRLFQRSAGSKYLPWMVLMNRAIAEGLSGPW
ncbi:hypothetical protein C8J56DRAFT_1067314 [Mycena floridula]|nr:hypothetical protein C8J56DRAFT_1067314 [Mycena floridula]